MYYECILLTGNLLLYFKIKIEEIVQNIFLQSLYIYKCTAIIRNSSLMKKSSPELVRIILSQTALIDANNTKTGCLVV